MLNSAAVSKVLVHDCNHKDEAFVREFCIQNNLTPVKPETNKVLETLTSNKDLGAVFISEDLHGYPGAGIELGKQIHRYRPELPIFLRLNEGGHTNQYTNSVFSGIYTTDKISTLRKIIKSLVFCDDYPQVFIDAVKEISQQTLDHFFEDVSIDVSTPYLVNDKLLFGDILSMLPMETPWCKGYLTVQCDDIYIHDVVKKDKLFEDMRAKEVSVNDIIAEIANMTWGGIIRHFDCEKFNEKTAHVQVPVIVNHLNNYINFGSKSPLLAMNYTIHRPDGTYFTLYFVLVFHLSWDPTWFDQYTPVQTPPVVTGELNFSRKVLVNRYLNQLYFSLSASVGVTSYTPNR